MKTKVIEICFIQEFPSVKEGIFDLTGISRSQLKKYALKKNFLEKPLKQKDCLELPLDLVNHLKINPLYSGAEVKILFEDDKLLAISKPPRIHCHPLSYCESDNVLSALLSQNKGDVLKINPSHYDRGLIYRLDYETSGLLIYCKQEELYQEIRSHFHEVVKSKYYLAVVTGECKHKKLIHYLAPKGKKGHVMVESHDGVLNEIKLETLAYDSDKDRSLVKVLLKEGHRHQIRAQLACAGHEIIGDELYGNQYGERLYLHCYEYELMIDDKSYKLRDDNINALICDFPSLDHKL